MAPEVFTESCPLSWWGSPHLFSPYHCWVILGLPHSGRLDKWCAVTGSRHADPILYGWGPRQLVSWIRGTDRPLLLIQSGQCWSEGTILMRDCTIFGSSRGKIHHKNWPYMFIFVWVSCPWPAGTNIGGIVLKAVILVHRVLPWYPGCVPCLHYLLSYIWRYLDLWCRFDHLYLWCVGVAVGKSRWLSENSG